jgi:hypothetical protein
MELLALISSLPDTAILVLVGITLTTVALILKKRVLPTSVEPPSTSGQTSDH